MTHKGFLKEGKSPMSDDFHGLPTAQLSNDQIRLHYLTEAGPRIVRLYFGENEENWLAETPGKTWETAHGRYSIRGGHRLWHGPEVAGRSDVPDDAPPQITALPDGVQLSAPIEEPTGVQKQLAIRLHPERPQLTLQHTLTNHNRWPIELAAWAITMMALGGTAVLPQTRKQLDAAGLQPNRCLVLWPYTRWQDPRLHPDDDFLLVDGDPSLPPCKIGTMNRRGWLGYRRDDLLFLKRFHPQAEAPHVDFGCNSEIYVNDQFLELETLSPLTRLGPGESVRHSETWYFLTGMGDAADRQTLRRILAERAATLDIFDA